MSLKKLIQDNIKNGDIVLFHNDLKKTLWILKDECDNDFNKATAIFIDLLIESVGEDGTLLIPCFNWDFCSGLPFDYKTTPSKTGILGNLVLKDSRFKRTKHPIYSFAVYGKYQEYLIALDNISSFGIDSPFGFLFSKNGKIILWDVNYQNSFTFAHFVEQQRNIDYRFEKIFTGKYIDESGKEDTKSYSMFVRNLDRGIITHLEPIGKILEDDGIVSKVNFDGLDIKLMNAKEVYERISLELNRSPYVMVKFEKYEEYEYGQKMHDLIRRLFPINRSLTGEGFRKSLTILSEYIEDLKIHKIDSGEKCFDWVVPQEWNVEEAYVEDLTTGIKIIDFKNHNLHIVGYSVPFEGVVDYNELCKHLHYREDIPNAIPYVTSYYNDYWGFCISYENFKRLDRNKKYKVVIKSKKTDGVLNYGDILIRGETEKEILFSTYLCHPSMANNELSGPVLAVFLANYLKEKKNLRHSYRFVFVPETIGSICYIYKNFEKLKNNLLAGFVLTCCGDDGEFSYLPSRYGNTLADKVVLNLLKYEVGNFKKYSFLDRGSDERQYCSPGVDLPVCSVMKSKYGVYREYHTSLDNLEFVTPKGLQESFEFYKKVIDVIENNMYHQSKMLCEPQMGKRGLYSTLSHSGRKGVVKTLMDFLAYADGKNDLIDIADILGESAHELIEVKNILIENGLIS